MAVKKKKNSLRSVLEEKESNLPAPPKTVKVTREDAPLYTVRYLELIHLELVKMNKRLSEI